MASVGSWITGSGTSATLTERFPCHVSAFTIRLSWKFFAALGACRPSFDAIGSWKKK
jgi:hypothetical protein